MHLTSKRRAPDFLKPHLRNPGFEDTDSDGNPYFWDQFRKGFIDVDPALAHDGQRSVRSAGGFGYSQHLLSPVSPYQNFAISGFAMRELPYEKAGIRSVFWTGNWEYINETASSSPIDAPPGQYGSFWTTQMVGEDAEITSVYLRGEAPSSWIRFDDLRLTTEQFSSFADEEMWKTSGGASVKADSILLPGNSQVQHTLAAGSAGEQYFTWGRYSDTTPGARISVSESRVPRVASEVTSNVTSLIELPDHAGVFVADPGFVQGSSGAPAQVTITGDEVNDVWIHSLRRGFAKAEPKTLVSGAGSPDRNLILTAAWPEWLTTASVQIFHGSDAIADLNPKVIGTSLRCTWDCGNLASGEYIARFTLVSSDEQVAVVDRPFKVILEAEAGVTPSSNQTEFVCASWFFFQGNESLNQLRQLINLSKADGFDFGFFNSNQAHMAAIRGAAEAEKMPFVFFLVEALAYSHRIVNDDWFSSVEFMAKIKSWFAALQGSPYFSGPYVHDYPVGSKAYSTVEKITGSFALDGSIGLPWMALGENVTPEDIAQMKPPVGSVMIYPFFFGNNQEPVRALLSRIPIENSLAKRLGATGRNLWVFIQSFVSRIYEDFYPVAPTLHSAQLGAAVLAGAKGYGAFTYTSNKAGDGLRNMDLTPSKFLEPYQQFNALMKRLGPTIMGLNVPELLPSVPYPFAVSTAVEGSGRRYAFVLNAHDETSGSLQLKLSTDGGDAAATDLVTEGSLPISPVGEMDVNLGPGQWAMIDIGQRSIVETAVSQGQTSGPETLSLPVTHQFLISRLDGTGQPVLGIDLSDDARSVAATIGAFAFEPSAPQIYHLLPDGNVEREAGPIAFPAEGYQLSQGGNSATLSKNLGFSIYESSSFSNGPAISFEGWTGGAFDIVRGEKSTWISMDDVGIRQLQEVDNGFVSVDVAGIAHGPYRDIFGPFKDGSIAAVVAGVGVRNIKPGLLPDNHLEYAFLHGVNKNASMNSREMLAVPRNSRGVGLFQLSRNGVPRVVGEMAEEAINVEAVSWVTNEVLAVADAFKGVIFYKVTTSGVEKIGTWVLPGDKQGGIVSMDSAQGTLAAGLWDGRVFITDVTSLVGETSAVSEWMLVD